MSTAHPAQPDQELRSGFDVSMPKIARVYDFWLGGKDSFAADRAEAVRLIGFYPRLPKLAWENRNFLTRVVTWLAGQGIRQFLDIRPGPPTAYNTHHQAAMDVDPSCRVFYVDNGPVVVGHATAILAGNGVAAIEADLASHQTCPMPSPEPRAHQGGRILARRQRPACRQRATAGSPPRRTQD